MYDLTPATLDDYLSDIQRRRTKSISSEHRNFLKNKLTFHLVFSETYPEEIPTLYGLLSWGRGFRRLPGLRIESAADLLQLVRDERVIIKPKIEAGGKGVHVLDHDGSNPIFDGESMPESRIRDVLESLPESIVVEYVDQAAYAAAVYPDAANTVRVLTMVDPSTEKPFIAAAVHRFGSRTSRHVDNFSSGGLSVAVDLETGELGKAVASTKGGSEFARDTHHPDTGARIEGATIPRWDAVRERVLTIADDYGDLLPYVGWDIVVTDDDGSFTLIEGNSSPDIDLIQTHRPLLADDRVRRFYADHGVI